MTCEVPLLVPQDPRVGTPDLHQIPGLLQNIVSDINLSAIKQASIRDLKPWILSESQTAQRGETLKTTMSRGEAVMGEKLDACTDVTSSDTKGWLELVFCGTFIHPFLHLKYLCTLPCAEMSPHLLTYFFIHAHTVHKLHFRLG